MYDFCFTFPFAGLLAFGGFVGFISKGSLPSLLGGVGSAAVLAVCAQLSLAAYHKGRLYKPATAVSLVVVSGLSIMMGVRWRKTGKFLPAGLVMTLSIVMAVFYTWNLLYLREPLSKPGEHKGP